MAFQRTKRLEVCLLAVTAAVAGAGGSLLAQTAEHPAPAAGERVAVISFNEAVLRTSEAQHDLESLRKKFAPTQAHLRELNSQVEKLKADVNGGKMTDAQRSALLREIDARTKQLQRESEDFQNDSQTESQEAFQGVAQKVYAFLQSYANRQGYTVVLDRGTGDHPVVWYAAAPADISADLVRAYDAAATTPSAPTPR